MCGYSQVLFSAISKAEAHLLQKKKKKEILSGF